MRLHGYNIYVTECLLSHQMKVNYSKDYRFNKSSKYTYDDNSR